MDFTYSEDQNSIRELSAQVLKDLSTDERLKELKEQGALFDKELWGQFAESGLLGMAVPEEFGGSGFGLTEICLMLEEQGRYVAPMPLLQSLALAGLTLAEYGSEAQKKQYLTALATGEVILTAAIQEEGLSNAHKTVLKAEQLGDSWVLNGERICVPYAEQSAVILVPATVVDKSSADKKTAVFLVNPKADGVELNFEESTNGEPLYTVSFNNTQLTADQLLADADKGEEVFNYMVDRGNVCLAATQVGVAEEALRRTVEYTNERKQFGKAISSFQGTTLRCADGYIDVEGMRSTYWQAVYHLEAGLNADKEIRAAKYWACIGGGRVVHTAQHLHGGIGSDLDFPLHRYFLWSKRNELTLGGGSLQLSKLGAMLADKDQVVNVL
ncbi:acyl-CoA dehydrogenase [Endozoicomonas sp. OPT23]|uniref:acyl-CoA dehydrogenase family protein n=1 Tax=Endozoicomonas sp. OPT23 TaxID=2072845 RepID=UPI00129BA8A6|nr:acyl-CoA dehydrogenase family protein [Endozoicomonas sp. OPT23]MRI33861.1 acyl-CoA dehydrogenase [Endozoicomonas sp. OPT23]